MIVPYELPSRFMIVFIEGVCTLAECRNFAEECGAIRLARSRDFFQNDVYVTSMGFTIRGEKPRIMNHFLERFMPPPVCRFTDQYTFLVSKHMFETYARRTSGPPCRS